MESKIVFFAIANTIIKTIYIPNLVVTNTNYMTVVTFVKVF